MSEYRRKPVVVDAMQLIDDLRNHTRIATWITVNGGDVDVPFAEPCLYVETPEGWMRAEIGDWIVKGVKGEFRTCDPITFEATYEPAAQPQPAPELAAVMAESRRYREALHRAQETLDEGGTIGRRLSVTRSIVNAALDGK